MAFPQVIVNTDSVTASITPMSAADIAQFRAFASTGDATMTFFAVLAQLNVTALTPATASQELAAHTLVEQGLIAPNETTSGTYAMTALGYIRMWATLAHEVEVAQPQITTDRERHLVESWLATLRQNLAGVWGDHLAEKILETLLVYFYVLVLNSPLPMATGIALVKTDDQTHA